MQTTRSSIHAKLPSFWKELVVVLESSSSNIMSSLQSAEMWWHQMVDSRFCSNWLSCSDLLDALVEIQPIIRNNELVFLPVFYHASTFLQCSIFAFICQHRTSISSSALLQFIHALDIEGELFRNEESNPNFARIRMLADYCAEAVLSDVVWSNATKISSCEEVPIPSTQHLKMTSGMDQFPCTQYLSAGELVKVHLSQGMSSRIAASQFSGNQNIDDDEDIYIPNMTLEEESKLKEKAAQLKDQWLTGTVIDEENKSIFSNYLAGQLKQLLIYIDPSSLQEVAIATASRMISEIGPDVSVQNSSVFARCCLLPIAQRLEQPASRVLTSAFVVFAKAFPMVMNASVFGPLMTSNTFGSFQADIIVRVSKEAFIVENYLQLLSQSLACASAAGVTEGILLVIQAVIEAKVDFSDITLLDKLIAVVENDALLQASNLKYGKLILAIVNTFGYQLSRAHQLQLKRVTELHKTFIKRSIQSALSKLNHAQT